MANACSMSIEKLPPCGQWMVRITLRDLLSEAVTKMGIQRLARNLPVQPMSTDSFVSARAKEPAIRTTRPITMVARFRSISGDAPVLGNVLTDFNPRDVKRGTIANINAFIRRDTLFSRPDFPADRGPCRKGSLGRFAAHRRGAQWTKPSAHSARPGRSWFPRH